MNKISSYIRSVYEELKQVAWPTNNQVLRDTLLVIGISLAVAIFLGALDLGLSALLQYIVVNY